MENSTYEEGFVDGERDKRRFASASDETRVQIHARYSYAVTHMLDHPFQAGYVDGFNSVKDKEETYDIPSILEIEDGT